MSCLRALSRQVASAGAGAVSWLCTWWRQGAGASDRVVGAGAGRWCCGLAVHVVGAPVLCAWWRQGAGAGAGCWLCTSWRQGAGGRWCWLCAWWRQGAGAGCGFGVVSWLCAWWRQGAGADAGCCGCARLARCRDSESGRRYFQEAEGISNLNRTSWYIHISSVFSTFFCSFA